MVRAELQRGIKAAKGAHKRKVEEHLPNNNPWLVWQGLQSINNYNGSTPVTTTADALLAEELNNFFSRFESAHSCAATTDLQKQYTHAPGTPSDTRTAAGPDGVLGKVLHACADHLVGVLTRMFNLSQATIPHPYCVDCKCLNNVLNYQYVEHLTRKICLK